MTQVTSSHFQPMTTISRTKPWAHKVDQAHDNPSLNDILGLINQKNGLS